MKINLDELQQRWERGDYLPVTQSLNDVGFRSVAALLSTFASCATDLAPWLEQAEINRDRNLRLQYLAGMGLNRFEGELIYDDLRLYRKFPEDLFIGSGKRMQTLRGLMNLPKSGK
jgi:spermidine synthase